MRILATSYTLSATSELDHTDAVERVREELKAEGFGVLCEIDVQATLKERLGASSLANVTPSAWTPNRVLNAHQLRPLDVR